jgi:hypothetical protein
VDKKKTMHDLIKNPMYHGGNPGINPQDTYNKIEDMKDIEIADPSEDFEGGGWNGSYAPVPPEYEGLVSMLSKGPQVHPHKTEKKKPLHEAMAEGPDDEEEDGLEDDVPGYAYVNHLARRASKIQKKSQAQKQLEDASKGKGHNIYTDHEEALKTAIGLIGLYSDKNPGGMPINTEQAKKFWFGDKDVEGREEAQWRSLVDYGDRNLDPKRIRKFVNFDGSMTMEVVNMDKTIMSRFTMGEHKGQFIFTQGGYNKFAALLEKMKQEKGPDSGSEFDSARSKFGG